MGKIRCSWTQL